MKTTEQLNLKGAETQHCQIRERGLKTTELIEYLRNEIGYTIAEIGRESRTPIRTVKAWASGETCPHETDRLRLIEVFSAPDATPPKRKIREMERIHGLTWEVKKRRWRLKLTFDRGPKFVGIRKSFPIKTTDPQTAIVIREHIVEAAGRFGLKVVKRIQKRKGAA